MKLDNKQFISTITVEGGGRVDNYNASTSIHGGAGTLVNKSWYGAYIIDVVGWVSSPGLRLVLRVEGLCFKLLSLVSQATSSDFPTVVIRTTCSSDVDLVLACFTMLRFEFNLL